MHRHTTFIIFLFKGIRSQLLVQGPYTDLFSLLILQLLILEINNTINCEYLQFEVRISNLWRMKSSQ